MRLTAQQPLHVRFYPDPHSPGSGFVGRALDLFEDNMKGMYLRCERGYDKVEKALELGDNDARYLIFEEEGTADVGDER